MKMKVYCFMTTVLSLLFSSYVFSQGVTNRSVTVSGAGVYLTVEAGIPAACQKYINNISGCSYAAASSSSGCPVSGLLTFNITPSGCSVLSLTFQGKIGALCSKQSVGGKVPNKGQSQAEVTFTPGSTSYDISLINGYSGAVTISPDAGSTISASSYKANSPAGQATRGVFPVGCSTCNGRASGDPCKALYTQNGGCSASSNCVVTNSSKHLTINFGG